MIPFPAPSCKWIWLSEGPEGINQYACFRKTFVLKKDPEKAILSIAADSDYRLKINGIPVYGRQFSDYPRYRSFNEHSIGKILKKGRNLISILSYYRGENSFEYRKGKAGLIFQLDYGDGLITSDRTCKCRLSPSFTSGPLPKVTNQMGFTVTFDARMEDKWENFPYNDSGWKMAAELSGPIDGYWKNIQPRPLPLLKEGAFLQGEIHSRGVFLRTLKRASAAKSVFHDLKHVEHTAENNRRDVVVDVPEKKRMGAFLIFDIGREEVGLLHFCVVAPEGTVIDVAHGEHLGDLGVRAMIKNREFADRYICRQGLNEFTLPFRRLGCRYLEFHFWNFSEPLTVKKAGIKPIFYPLFRRGCFKSGDTLLNRMYETAVRTLELCMHEHYEDCPWREQSLYAFDSRNQALYGYYGFGEYDFPRESFRLLGWSLRNDGLLELCAPAKVKITIPVFSLVWISALRDHFLFSGQDTLFREFDATIQNILSAFLSKKDKETSLYKLFEGKDYWTFYEWAPGLSKKMDKRFRLDAPHNLFILEAIESYCDMLIFSSQEEKAAKWLELSGQLRKAVHRVFWDKDKDLYATFSNRKEKWHYCALTQALAVVLGICTKKRKKGLQKS